MSDPITFGSVCSGIEAASEALLPLGWSCAFHAEIDEQANAVLRHRYPGVPNLGDLELIDGREWPQADVLIGGTPCQSFSIAGKRGSLSDARGNLALSFVRLSHAINAVRVDLGRRPLVVVWENVPGVLNTSDNAFGCLLAGFVGCDSPVVSPLELGRWPDAGLASGPLARCAWRVLDAQYFELAQRRERVLLVVSFGDGPDPAAILFEPAGLSRNPPARGAARQGSAAGPESGAGDGEPAALIPDVAWALQERDAKGADSSTKDGHLIIEAADLADPIIAREAKTYDHGGKNVRPRNLVAAGFEVRRLTPTECERLQGFADGHTLVPWQGRSASDSARYRQLGNSMPVNVIRWLGRRIEREIRRQT